MNDILEQIGVMGLVPIVVIEDADDASGLGQALLAGGLPCAEITFRTAAAETAIRLLSAEYPEMLVGAGTVLTVAQAETAMAAGARFIVTPGFDSAVVDWCLANDIPITPGVMTPTEISMALNKGIEVLKYFPAEAAGGVKALQAIGGPYRTAKFLPTGGITAVNLPDYLRLPMVHACGGSWMVPSSLINGGQFAQITKLTAEAVAIVDQMRG